MSIAEIEIDPRSIAVPDAQTSKLILGHDLTKATRDRMRERGEWPPCFYVAGAAYVLRADIATFIEAAKGRAMDRHQESQARGRKAVAARWSRAALAGEAA